MDVDDRQFEFFDRFTPAYDERRLAFALDDMRRSTPGSLAVIDVGCGNGATLAHLASAHPLASVTGLDPSPAYVEQARAAVDGTFEVGSVLDTACLEPHRGRYDRVIMAAVLHHLVGSSRRASKHNAVRAIHNGLTLLRPGGKLYLFEPTHGPPAVMAAAFWIKLAGIRLGGNRRIELGRPWINVGAPLVSFLTDAEVRQMISAAGGHMVATSVIDERKMGPVHQRRVGHTIAARDHPRPSPEAEHPREGGDRLDDEPRPDGDQSRQGERQDRHPDQGQDPEHHAGDADEDVTTGPDHR